MIMRTQKTASKVTAFPLNTNVQHEISYLQVEKWRNIAEDYILSITSVLNMISGGLYHRADGGNGPSVLVPDTIDPPPVKQEGILAEISVLSKNFSWYVDKHCKYANILFSRVVQKLVCQMDKLFHRFWLSL